jgi:hypothetical protein
MDWYKKSGGISSMDVRNNTNKKPNYLIDLGTSGNLNITAIAQDGVGNIWTGTVEDGVFVID